MRKKATLVCQQRKIDCFAFGDVGRCKVLRDTEFPGDCPFYKTQEQRQDGHQKSVERLIDVRPDLIIKYGQEGFQPIIWGDI